jgi:hypothetical protein
MVDRDRFSEAGVQGSEWRTTERSMNPLRVSLTKTDDPRITADNHMNLINKSACSPYRFD